MVRVKEFCNQSHILPFVVTLVEIMRDPLFFGGVDVFRFDLESSELDQQMKKTPSCYRYSFTTKNVSFLFVILRIHFFINF